MNNIHHDTKFRFINYYGGSSLSEGGGLQPYRIPLEVFLKYSAKFPSTPFYFKINFKILLLVPTFMLKDHSQIYVTRGIDYFLFWIMDHRICHIPVHKVLYFLFRLVVPFICSYPPLFEWLSILLVFV